jgi:hypothetical protein
MRSRRDYFAWYTYDLFRGSRYVATIRTDEVRYFRGHVHGVRPRPTDIAALQVALFNAVIERTTELGIGYPGNATVLARALLRTRTARA